jgi:hypothetical protein
MVLLWLMLMFVQQLANGRPLVDVRLLEGQQSLFQPPRACHSNKLKMLWACGWVGGCALVELAPLLWFTQCKPNC